MKTWKERKAEKDRKDLAEFIREKVIDENFDMDRLEGLKDFTADNDGEDLAYAFCDYFDLGNWFYEAMIQCDFDTERFMTELECDMQTECEEAARDRAEIEDDYLRSVGAK